MRRLPAYVLALLPTVSPAVIVAQVSAPDQGVVPPAATSPAGQRVRHPKRKRMDANPRRRARPERRAGPTAPVHPQHRVR